MANKQKESVKADLADIVKKLLSVTRYNINRYVKDINLNGNTTVGKNTLFIGNEKKAMVLGCVNGS